MPYTQAHPSSLPALKAIQDVLQATDQDLQQLDVMLNHHCEGLIAAFEGALKAFNEATVPTGEAVHTASAAEEGIHKARQLLSQAVFSMQFQDIASQMLGHCQTRLQACNALIDQADTLPFDDEATSLLPPLKGPVTQASLDAGTIDLFDMPAPPKIQGETP